MKNVLLCIYNYFLSVDIQKPVTIKTNINEKYQLLKFYEMRKMSFENLWL